MSQKIPSTPSESEASSGSPGLIMGSLASYLNQRFDPLVQNWRYFEDRQAIMSSAVSFPSQPADLPPATAFPKFNLLASELRAKIWKHALPGPRLIPILYKRTNHTYTHRAPSIALLHVCFESRQETLKVYQELTLGELTPMVKPGCYVNFSIDQIFLSTNLYIGPRDIHRGQDDFQREFQRNDYNLRKTPVSVYQRKSPQDWQETRSFMAYNIAWDLYHSNTGLQLLQNLTVDLELWLPLQEYIFSADRHPDDIPLKHLTVVVQRKRKRPVVSPSPISNNGKWCCKKSAPIAGQCKNKLHLALVQQKKDMLKDYKAQGKTGTLDYDIKVRFLDDM